MGGSRTGAPGTPDSKSERIVGHSDATVMEHDSMAMSTGDP